MAECVETCKFDDKSWLRIDNTAHNLGIQRSVNHGIDKMFRDDSEWLIYMSATMRFGYFGGLDFIEHLSDNNMDVVEAYGPDSSPGWHCVAFSRSAIEKAGRWDENFYPAQYDDLDYSVRVNKCYMIPQWSKAQIDCFDAGTAHSTRKAGVHVPATSHIFYFQQKWGRHPDRPGGTHDRPWNDKDNPVGYWPSCEIGGVIGRWNQTLPMLEDYHG
jgi:hypothetical protein